MINKEIKDITFDDLLELQKQLDEEVAKPRENGFVPRKRTLLDIKLALDDEFQEWLRELPAEYNFKTWKKKEYKREDELIELVDCLFFFLQYKNTDKTCTEHWSRAFDCFEGWSVDFDGFSFNEIDRFKCGLWDKEFNFEQSFSFAYFFWIGICKLRGFSKDEIIETYLNKWKKNMQRIKGDWSNEV